MPTCEKVTTAYNRKSNVIVEVMNKLLFDHEDCNFDNYNL